jgi:hypothetical protein
VGEHEENVLKLEAYLLKLEEDKQEQEIKSKQDLDAAINFWKSELDQSQLMVTRCKAELELLADFKIRKV